MWSSTAYYYWKKHEVERAIALWERALELDPSSAEIHYSLGLSYFDMKDFNKSEEHARVAYALQYPLPGLKKKLESVGHWSR